MEKNNDELMITVEAALNLIVILSDFRKDRKYPFKYYEVDGKTRRGYVQVVIEED